MTSCNSLSARLAALEAEVARLRARVAQVEHVPVTEAGDAVTPERDAVTDPKVTRGTPDTVAALTPEQARKAKNAEKSRNYRLRRRLARGVTREGDAVTPKVTMVGGLVDLDLTHPPPSPRHRHVTEGFSERGALAVVEVSAHAAREKPPAPREELPAGVTALREAWQTLVVPHGFAPWPERTSKRLLQDALRALETRPLEEWRKVFALVPRSPVCRGELPKQRGRMDLVRLLVGEPGADGYEPAEKLLLGSWSVDAEPSAAPVASAAAPPEAAPTQPLPRDTPEARAWGAVLGTLREQQRYYALRWLDELRPVALREGVLLLEVVDRFQADWLAEHYGQLLREVGAQHGVTQVEYVLPAGGAP